jgi:NAD-dependent dihydropyrimidine dehydrogenase PreA subunit
MCKKSQRLLGHPCSKPEEVCMAVIRADGVETLDDWGRAITKDEAIAILRRAEEAGLVHLTNNLQNGHWFVCNCCGCCCAVLRTINEMDVIDVVNTHFYASIDPGRCKSCGTCREKRCQVRAIQAGPRAHEVDEERCIGCGLCVSTCPEHAIELVRKSDAEDVIPLKDDAAWNSERARRRSTPAGQ